MLVLILLLSYFLLVKSSGIPIEINSGTCESNGYVEATKDQCQYWYSKINYPPPSVDFSYANQDWIPGCSTDHSQTLFNNNGGNKECGFSNHNCICWQPSDLIKSEGKCNKYIEFSSECETMAQSLGLTFSTASHPSWESIYAMGCFMSAPNYWSSTSAQDGGLSAYAVYFNPYPNTIDCGRNNHNCICRTSCTEHLVIPEGTVTFTDSYEGCTTLKTVSFPSSLTHIGERVFKETGLTSVVLPEGLETIGKSLFEECESLESISFPSTLETIPEEFCNSCSALTTLTFAEGLKYIEGDTFNECPLLEEITFPDSLETIGEAAFKDSGLKRVYNLQGVSYETDQGDDNTFPCLANGFEFARHGQYPLDYKKYVALDGNIAEDSTQSISANNVSPAKQESDCAAACFTYRSASGVSPKGFLVQRSDNDYNGRCYCSFIHSSDVASDRWSDAGTYDSFDLVCEDEPECNEPETTVYITAHEGNYCENQLRGINEGTGDDEIKDGYSYGIEGDWKGSVDKCYQRCITELKLSGFYIHEEWMNFGCMCATDDCTERGIGSGKQVSYTLSDAPSTDKPSEKKCRLGECMSGKYLLGGRCESCEAGKRQINAEDVYQMTAAWVCDNRDASYTMTGASDDETGIEQCKDVCRSRGEPGFMFKKSDESCKCILGSCESGFGYSGIDRYMISTPACETCPNGYFQDQSGQTSCSECAKGKYSDQSGQTSCSECPAGFHQDAVAQSSCKECGEGKFTATVTSSICQTCPNGFDSGPGASSCFNPDDCVNSVCGNGGCTDGLGSYMCNCYPGWEKDADGNCNVDIDYCLENEDTACQTPDGDFGVCSDGNVSFSCDCSSTDYEGENCNIWIDDCAGVVCGWSMHGCGDLNRDYECYCNDGTTSSYCEEPPDPCDDIDCGYYGSCDGGICTCTQGHSGSRCDIPPAPPDPCDGVNCGYYGSCNSATGACDCESGYSGTPCTFVDRCSPNPCENYVQCHTIDNDYRCECLPGYNGKDCDNDIDECVGKDCGHGTCIDEVDGFKCECKAGYVTTTGYCDTDEDNCPGKDCGHGTCKDELDGFRCECDNGYTGAACDENPYDCPTDACSGNGYCTDGLNDYNCTCNLGWFGKDCESNINYCEDVDCMNGECIDKISSFECNCDAGWGIGSAGKCTVDIDGCADSPCKNGGECTDLVGGFECECATGWEGGTCEVNPNNCGGIDCGPGTCVDGLSAYTCDCGSSGYEGDHCELNKNDCLLGSCNSHGTCNDGVNSFTCSCHDGWEGDHCELSVDDCPSTPCSGHGTCVDEHKGYRCECTTGFTGDLCDYEVNNCVGISCGEGICKNKPGGYDCECTLGWALKDGKCTENIDDCFVEGVGLIDCGDGVCQDGVNEYTCKCSLGFSGDHCETNIDECTPDPCENGDCTDGINDFTCACEGGWFGKRCDQECLVDSDCDYKCSKGKCVAYSFFGDFKFYMLGIWCVIAFVLVFLASLKSVHKRVVDFNKSEPEFNGRQRYR